MNVRIEVDPRVERVVDFMQREFLADELQGIAKALGVLAPMLWKDFSKGEEVELFRFREAPLTPEEEVHAANCYCHSVDRDKREQAPL
ncbi:MAG: hypothetical protein ACLQPD_10500 [Desulfomonilaceae bacterium]